MSSWKSVHLQHVRRLRASFWVATACASLALLLPSCESLKSTLGTPTTVENALSGGAATTPEDDAVNVGFLLSMTWAESKKLSPQSLEIPPFYKVAADEVKVLKADEAGRPLKVRAKGRVFLQVDFREEIVALGQEAYIESGGELIVRGKPLLKRGRSLVEGLSDLTVFYIQGTRLQVLGKHRLTKQGGGASGPGGTPSFDVLPTWKRSWKDGPNPLLPALSPEDIPKELRVNPLLPPAADDEVPKTLPEEVEKAVVPPGASNPAPASPAPSSSEKSAPKPAEKPEKEKEKPKS